MRMRFFGNTADPSKVETWKRLLCYHDETPEMTRRRLRQWLRDKSTGDPQPTEKFTVQQLKDFGMVGVYRAEIDAYAREHPEECIVEYGGWLEPGSRF